MLLSNLNCNHPTENITNKQKNPASKKKVIDSKSISYFDRNSSNSWKCNIEVYIFPSYGNQSISQVIKNRQLDIVDWFCEATS